MWPQCRTNTLTMLNRVKSNPNQEFPDDEEFKKNILYGNLYDRRLRDFIIGEYELHLNSNLRYIAPFTVDHICPQARSGDWSTKFNDDNHDLYNNSWANLVPLSSSDNSSKGTSGWARTRAKYRMENLFVSTKQVAEYDDWNLEALKLRAAELYEWAKIRWPYPG